MDSGRTLLCWLGESNISSQCNFFSHFTAAPYVPSVLWFSPRFCFPRAVKSWQFCQRPTVRSAYLLFSATAWPFFIPSLCSFVPHALQDWGCFRLICGVQMCESIRNVASSVCVCVCTRVRVHALCCPYLHWQMCVCECEVLRFASWLWKTTTCKTLCDVTKGLDTWD